MTISLRNAINTLPDSVKPFFALLLSIICSGMFFFIGLKSIHSIYDVDFSNLSQTLSNTANPVFVSFLRFFMAMQTIALFAIPPFVVAWVYNKKSFSLFTLNIFPHFYYLLITIVIIVVANPCINLLVELNGTFLDSILGSSNSLKDQDIQTQKLVEALMKESSYMSLFLNTCIIAFLPAALEELFFRGFLQNVVIRKNLNIHIAIFSTAFLFSFLHFQFYGFLPRFVLGVMFGYFYYWSKSLWTTIIVHFINNFIAVLGMFLISKSVISDNFETLGTGSTHWIGYLSISVVCVLVLILCRKYTLSTSNLIK